MKYQHLTIKAIEDAIQGFKREHDLNIVFHCDGDTKQILAYTETVYENKNEAGTTDR